jgi:hypothetical protein
LIITHTEKVYERDRETKRKRGGERERERGREGEGEGEREREGGRGRGREREGREREREREREKESMRTDAFDVLAMRAHTTYPTPSPSHKIIFPLSLTPLPIDLFLHGKVFLSAGKCDEKQQKSQVRHLLGQTRKKKFSP